MKEGQKVFYYATGQYRKVIEETGAVFCGYKVSFRNGKRKNINNGEYTQSSFHSNFRSNKSKLSVLNEICSRIIRIHESEIVALKPDLIIHDTLCIWGNIIAEKLGVANIASHVDFIYTQELRNADLKQILQNAVKLPRNSAISKYESKFARLFNLKINGALGEENTGDKEFLDLFYSKHLNIVYMPKEFQPHYELLDEALYKFVGYEECRERGSNKFPFYKLGINPIVYIALGHIPSKEYIDFIEMCFEVFGDIGKTVVISVCNRQVFNEIKTRKVPGNFIIKNYVPQVELLKRAGLFISHGGLSSVREALPYHVPLIIIPRNFDQVAVAEQVERFGAGVYIKTIPESAEELRRLYEATYCNIEIMSKCKELHDLFIAAGTYKDAAEYILNLKKM